MIDTVEGMGRWPRGLVERMVDHLAPQVERSRRWRARQLDQAAPANATLDQAVERAIVWYGAHGRRVAAYLDMHYPGRWLPDAVATARARLRNALEWEARLHAIREMRTPALRGELRRAERLGDRAARQGQPVARFWASYRDALRRELARRPAEPAHARSRAIRRARVCGLDTTSGAPIALVLPLDCEGRAMVELAPATFLPEPVERYQVVPDGERWAVVDRSTGQTLGVYWLERAARAHVRLLDQAAAA